MSDPTEPSPYYLESDPSEERGATAKRVLYVEVLPSRRADLRQFDEEPAADPLDVDHERSSSPPDQNNGNSSPKRQKKKTNPGFRLSDTLICDRSDCGFIAEELSALNQHKKTEHRGRKHFLCDRCSYEGSAASDLRKHYRRHTGEVPYRCDATGCDYKAKHVNGLVYHKNKYHPTGPPLKCDASTVDSCPFATHSKAALRLHKMMAHGGAKSLVCEKCPYACYLMADLRKHHRVHTGENPYRCDYEGCRYACKISSNLRKHKRIHTEEKPYACDACKFRTNFVNSLKVHKRTHTDERPYCCDQCGYRCNHTSNLKKHVTRMHPGAAYSVLKVSKNQNFS